MDDLSVVLEYRRKKPSWVCPECDTENSLSEMNCMFCGCERTEADNIIPEWKKNEILSDMDNTKELKVYKEEAISHDKFDAEYEDDDSYLLWVIAGTVFLAFILACAIAVNIWNPAVIFERIFN